ncbi:winged helix-turn-helix transcriptional regulator [Ignavigranum ruoffiae]|uniref:carbohydrate kinase n=1 Tax=Ignavigranum ruoffiae TaxID=89093 RepID=UPI00206908B2|nr:carbohydrate kinase [Ignavigranum ruoffiae]UPQ86349.1 winged helix-turn-helix transcriptional regulator [Ignavigranum ruoffiae]
MLSHNEERILLLLKENPFLSQQEIADLIHLSRSTVATLISNLIEKKYLLGRAYVLNQSSEIVCIGAMNLDRKYFLKDHLQAGTSNPVISSQSMGGVARNVSENLGRLGLDVSLVSLAGNDKEFDWIRQQSQPYINFQYVQNLSNYPTGSYTAVIDSNGEMTLALADMEIYDQMTLSWIQQYQTAFSSAKALVVDLNPPLAVVEYVINFARQTKVPLYLIPVSGPKMARLPKDLTGVTGMIVNLDESQTYFSLKDNDRDLAKIAPLWMGTGLEQIVLTHGSQPSYYLDRTGQTFSIKPPQVDQVVEVTGAGDAFSAGMIYAWIKGYPADRALELAMANANLCIQSRQTVRKDLNETLLENYRQTIFRR